MMQCVRLLVPLKEIKTEGLNYFSIKHLHFPDARIYFSVYSTANRFVAYFYQTVAIFGFLGRFATYSRSFLNYPAEAYALAVEAVFAARVVLS